MFTIGRYNLAVCKCVGVDVSPIVSDSVFTVDQECMAVSVCVLAVGQECMSVSVWVLTVGNE